MLNYFFHIKYLISFFTFRLFDLISNIKSKEKSAIILFHHITDDESLSVEGSCKCSIGGFIRILDYLKENKDVISINKMIGLIAGKDRVNNKVVISFDDVPDDFMANAYPYLLKYKFPFTLYITTSFLDKEGYLSTDDLLSLSLDPLCSIGCHTNTHPFLSSPNIDLRSEILFSKITIENLIKKPVYHFAYPYGKPIALNSKVIKYVMQCGYKSSVTTIPGYINKFCMIKMFELPRINFDIYLNKKL